MSTGEIVHIGDSTCGFRSGAVRAYDGYLAVMMELAHKHAGITAQLYNQARTGVTQGVQKLSPAIHARAVCMCVRCRDVRMCIVCWN